MHKLTLSFILLLAVAAHSQTSRHAFSFDDAASLRSASPVAVSPDGKSVLYQVHFGGHKGPTNTEWNLIAATGGESRHLNLPEKFKPTGFTRQGGALYGLAEVNKMQQLATLPLAPPNTAAAAAATPVPLTGLPRGIHSALISPDGSRYALLADPRLPDPLAEVHTVIEAEPSSLYVIGADGTNGNWWCPALHDVNAIAWSHDGSSIAILSVTPSIGYHYVRSFIDICSAAGAKHIATIDNAATGIGWINGDKDLVFLSTTTSVLTPDHVWTVSSSGGAPEDRTPKLDASALGVFVDARGKAWVNVAHGVRDEVDFFQNNALTVAYTWPDGIIGGPPVSPQIAGAPDVQVFVVSDPQHPSNVAVSHGNTLQRITTEGDDQLAKVSLGRRPRGALD